MAEGKKFSASDVLLHTKKDDCWLLICGKVYDMTKFLDDHPWGDGVLLQASGSIKASGDAIDAFENVGHRSTAESMMEGYLIGLVDGYVALHEAVGVALGPISISGKTKTPAAPSSTSSSFNPLPLLVFALVVAAWYYFTFIFKNKE